MIRRPKRPRRRRRPVLRWRVGLAVLSGAAAAVLGAWSAWLLFTAVGTSAAVLGLVLHVLAAGLAFTAAALGGASPCERDLIAVLGVAMPFCGPAIGWWIVVARAFDVMNAQAAFEQHEELKIEEVATRAEHELRVTSHAQILRQGSLEEKRNLLRRLGSIGAPRYLALLRQFLRDPEPELRLCAYAELARLAQQREEAIGALRERAEELDRGDSEASAEAWAALALAQLGYAISGLLDPDMGAYWLEQALVMALRAFDRDPSCRAGQRAMALLHAELGNLEAAWRSIVAWPDVVGEADESARAELAFRRRDYGACRASAARMQRAGWQLPAWLQAVVGAEADEPSPGAGRGGDQAGVGGAHDVAFASATARTQEMSAWLD